jgi:cysteine desulfurase
MMALDVAGIAVSTGSACSSGAVDPSPILLGMGLTPREARECVRFSLGRTTSEADVERAVAVTRDLVRRTRQLSAQAPVRD